jgi:choline dehydrogenase-like flavoprotein
MTDGGAREQDRFGVGDVFGDGGLLGILAAAADRIIPSDEWPSATGLGVIGYLERQAGTVHRAYWRDVLQPGLLALNREATARSGRSFDLLEVAEQDQLLSDVESGRVQNWPVPPSEFFATLVRLVTEGYYVDPGNGGDAAKRSWEMIGYRDRPTGAADQRPKEADVASVPVEAAAPAYDAVVVGAGAGGGVAAAVLSEAGLRVLVVERGRWLRFDEIGTDHLRNHRHPSYDNSTGPPSQGFVRTFVDGGGVERTTVPIDPDYHNNAMTIGGGTRVYGGQAWRFLPEDFKMASRYGVPDASSLADWPISYDELEPYYERAEWEIGVAGRGGEHALEGPRRRPYPMPPLPYNREAGRLQRAAEKLGWRTGAVPLLINTVPRDGRPACERCGQCVGFGCPTNAKNGTHNTTLVRGIATGRLDIVTSALVERLETDARGRVTGVSIVSGTGQGTQRRSVRARHVVVAGGAIESARLLLNSATAVEPNGLGNTRDQVGRHLQGHVSFPVFGLFEEPVQDSVGPGPAIATRQFSHANPLVVGGGMLANDFIRFPLTHWHIALPPEVARWGAAGKAAMRDGFRRTASLYCPAQEIPVADARVRLSPTVRDRFGVPVAMLSGRVHPESLRTAAFLRDRAFEWLSAAGAARVWSREISPGLSAGQHQAGTLRMGADPAVSVTDPAGRIHGHDNVWVADGSLHVTNGGVNPVLTIYALAFRTATGISRL